MRKGGENHGVSSSSAVQSAHPSLSAYAAAACRLPFLAGDMMHCANPFVNAAGRAFGCGQCLACRINRQRIWANRICMEADQYENNAFVTLTYDEEHLPNDRSLDPSHLRGFLNRLRGRYSPERFRFFAVGEYGDETNRPHYHAALFNFPTCERGRSSYSRVRQSCCPVCDMVREAWGSGNVLLGKVEAGSAAYLAAYVVKKMTAVDDARLNGRKPEFARMSLKNGGIGYPALHDIASTLMQYNLEQTLPDVPSAIRVGSREMPIGRYLRGKLREMVGKERNAPQSVLDAIDEEMLPLRLAARSSEIDPSLKSAVIRNGVQRRRNAEARTKIRKARKSL